MFERFTSDARDAVTGAVARAREADAASVTEEHLLLSLMDLGALDALDVNGPAITADLAAAGRRGGMSRADEEALAGLGIDLSEIVSRIEETHGEGALTAPASRRRGLGASLRTALGRPEPVRRHVPLTQGAKKALEQSLRIALGRKDGHIGTPHLLLALLTRPGTVSEVLADHGVTYARVEAVLAA
ncbi:MULTISPECIES: Clp protease N-terminal domain-containing protein [unclassified Streptomyces]|uniref:Clp protease N-terminal domain-containing protein n=1 Tax=unclassified Streptomyces TaxID=2593676 RepID=UPI0033C56EDD